MLYLAITLAVACAYLGWQLHRSQKRVQTEREDAYELAQGLIEKHQEEQQTLRRELKEDREGLLDRWEADRSSWQAERRELIDEARMERQVLIDRVQAPEKAVEHAATRVQALEADGTPKHVPADGSPHADKVWTDLVEDGVIGGR